MDLEQIKDRLDWLSGLRNKDVIKAQMLEYQASEGEEKKKAWQEIEAILQTYDNLKLFSDHPLSRPPSKEKASDGIFTIGTVINAGKELYPWKVTESDIFNHWMVVSAPNHGKSTFLAYIAVELLNNDVSWVMFDPKNDFAGLVKIHPEILLVDAHKHLRFNIFEAPPNVDPKSWRSLVIDALAHIGGWGIGVKGYLQKAVDVIVSERGNEFHLGHVHELISGWSETGRASQDYRSVLLSRLELFNEWKDVFWCSKSMPFEDMEHLIIRTNQVSAEVHSLIFEIILLRAYQHRLVNNIKDEAATLKVFFCEEASKGSLASTKENDWTAREISTPTITKFLSESRQFHLGVLASDQRYSALSDSLKSVSSTKIIGRLNSGKDIEEVSDDMMLEGERDAIPKLQTGDWIVRTAKINKPFMIRTPDFKIPRITEIEIEEHMVSRRFWIEKEKKVEEIKKSVSSALSQDEWYLLKHVNEHPFTQFSNRLRQGMGKGRLELAKHSLVEKGLAVEHTVKIGAYRPWKLLELTNDGINLLSSVGHNIGFWKHIKHEGIEHVMYKYLISDKLKQLGFDTKREHRIDVENGYRVVDIFFEDGEKKVGIEIECSTTDIENKIKALQILDIIVLGYTTEETLQRVSNWLAEHKELNSKVRLVLLSDYLKELQSLIRRDSADKSRGLQAKADSNSDGTKAKTKGERDE
ncbi:MAG: hypothetical protein ACRD38_01295 [Nitrososphaerales archaeon]